MKSRRSNVDNQEDSGGMMAFRKYVIFYLLFCVIGTSLEWGYGALWDIVGTSPWVYPNSSLGYTSLEVIPLWGLGGIMCVSVYQAIIQRRIRLLFGLVLSLVLAAAWILAYAQLIA